MGKHPLYNESGLLINNHPQVLYALVDKRAEIDGNRIIARNELLRLEYELSIVDEAIKIFDPNLEVEIKPKRIKKEIPKGKEYCFSFSNIRKVILVVLESKKEPFNRDDIYIEIARLGEIDLNNGSLRQKLKNVASQQLERLVRDESIFRKDLSGRNNTLYSINRFD